MAFEPVTIGDATFKTEDELKAHISELEKGSLRQSEFTKKTQELAASKVEVEKQKSELIDALKVKAILAANPELAEELDKLLEKKASGTSAQSKAAVADIEALTKRITEDLEAKYKPLAEDTKAIKDRLAAEDNKKALDQFNSTIEGLLKADGRTDVLGSEVRKDAVIQAALAYAGRVYESTKEVVDQKDLKKFVSERTNELYGDKDLAGVIAAAEKRKKIGDGSGSAGASDVKYVERGTPKQTEHIKGILEKLGFHG
jgi:archaellum component FlaC